MTRKLPSLHLLHVFDAAGRHLSFKQAAAELHVTPSAVSHQIKALEAQLGIELFQRGNRSLQLTDAGQAYLGTVERCFVRLREATGRLRHEFSAAALRISMISTLSRHIVIPRLDSFQARVPGVQLHIESSETVTDFKTQQVDVALRFGMGDWAGLESERLLDLECTPVCSGEFARIHEIRSPQDLSRQRLIQIAFFPEAWSTWGRAAGLGELESEKSLWFDTYDASIQAAEQGLGLALGVFPIEQTQLDDGRLVAPIDLRVTLPQKLYMVYRPGDGERAAIRAFHDWFLEQFRAPA